jgi:nucleoside-diphosphate-sugar epimerase
VSGASGFIGSHTIIQLLEAGYRVRGTVRSLKNLEKVQFLVDLQNPNLELVEADLHDAESWVKAAQGCDYCCHIASPFPIAQPRDEMELIKPAVEGTRNVLTACSNAGVKRVVLTSSCAAVMAGRESEAGKIFTEEDWANEAKCEPYSKSKLFAEKAAWELQKELPEGKRFELCTINPSFVQGPLLNNIMCSSQEPLAMLLNRKQPGVADLHWAVVDVREIAFAHVAALTKGVDGNRYIVSARTIALPELAKIVAKTFDPMGYRVPEIVFPKFVLRVIGLWDPIVRSVASSSGVVPRVDGSKAERELGVKYRDISESLVDGAHALIRFGLVQKKAGYKDPAATASA